MIAFRNAGSRTAVRCPTGDLDDPRAWNRRCQPRGRARPNIAAPNEQEDRAPDIGESRDVERCSWCATYGGEGICIVSGVAGEPAANGAAHWTGLATRTDPSVLVVTRTLAQHPVAYTADNDPPKAFRPSGEQGSRYCAAHRVADQVGGLDFQMIHERDDVVAHLSVLVRLLVMRLVALAVPAYVEREDAESGRDQCRDHPGATPVPLGAARQAVDEHHRTARRLRRK